LADVGARGVAHLDHRDDAGLDLGIVEAEQVALAARDVGGPRAGEAVGLLLGVDRAQPDVEHAGAGLDGVAVLVRGHHTDGGDAEPLDEVGQAGSASS
jgi:hypothetical protein